MTIFLEAAQVRKSFKGHEVLRDVSFQVPQGEIVGLLGPNGSGKTTIVRLLNGVIAPDGGQLRVAGHDPVRDGDAIRRISGILTEGAGLYHEQNAVENLQFFAKLYGVKERGRIEELLALFDLTEHQSKPVGTYSTGMKKRLGLAKALLHRPRVLFLDEPTNGLDPEGIRMVMKYIRTLNRQEGTTILLCSHVLHQIEEVCDRYVFLQNGRIIEQGTLPEIEDRYMTEIHLQVETNLQVTGGSYHGHKVERIGEQSLRFTLASKDEISPLLQQVLQDAWVHAAEITNRDLETLYFTVRGRHGDE
ncbi:MAG TPA: ABC transporter ATP-binding protein [Bacilli bacterium]|nr:ABC transporter ATP-binding protein [Bacilli bacterium]